MRFSGGLLAARANDGEISAWRASTQPLPSVAISSSTHAPQSGSHCTLAVTLAGPVMTKAQVGCLFPPLEHAPDQITSRPLVALSVIEVPGCERR
jgi:hypothetical protein